MVTALCDPLLPFCVTFFPISFLFLNKQINKWNKMSTFYLLFPFFFAIFSFSCNLCGNVPWTTCDSKLEFLQSRKHAFSSVLLCLISNINVESRFLPKVLLLLQCFYFVFFISFLHAKIFFLSRTNSSFIRSIKGI